MINDSQNNKPQIALIGGNEFSRACEPVDRHLLNTLRKRTPKVAIIPTAVGHLTPQTVIDKAVRYFTQLKAEAYEIGIHDESDANDPKITKHLRQSDAIYLTGGDPIYLINSLKNSLFLSELTNLYLSGHMIIGSSAGAMALCESMQVPPGSGELIDGLNLIPNLCILPHYENLAQPPTGETSNSNRSIPSKAAITFIGIDSQTALFLDGNDLKVLGSGFVTVIGKHRTKQYASGSSVDNLLPIE